MEYILEKPVWNEDDYEVMGWHDASIYGIVIENKPESFSSNLLLDIDYIFKWVNPIPPDDYFTFWVAPCTLVFKEAFNLIIDIDYRDYMLYPCEIADLYLVSKIEQSNNVFVYEWNIELQQGSIRLKSVGFEQIVKKYPMHVRGQLLDIDQRGGINFYK